MAQRYMIFHDYTACPRYDIPFNSPHEDVFHTNHLFLTEQIHKQTKLRHENLYRISMRDWWALQSERTKCPFVIQVCQIVPTILGNANDS